MTDQARRIESGGAVQSECRHGGPYGALKQESFPGPVRPARWYHIDNRARG